MSATLSPPLKLSLDAALTFFYPEVCQICGDARAARTDGYVCAGCWQAVRFVEPPFCERCGLPFAGEITMTFECSNCREMELHFQKARAAVAARGVVLEAIHRYKYQRALWFEPFLADLLQRKATAAIAEEKWDLLVPVPLFPLKQREREFNQAERLARCLSRHTGLPVNAKLLHRVEPTRTQTLLTRSERAENVRRAFRVAPGAKLKGQRVVLVDDVLTTGATASACAKELKAAGAGDICVWTVARALSQFS